ncbi:filamentous hemagglutinin N-terminal domain-containing protein [Allomesorhizobium camelthorni]|uniref:Filamentous hemagglutinin N-terminal domain-containing protein n=1 Tax=Allomesorhizobium camelthorni TaxID=475069 RepID=A0A6G4WFE9_9HYPH|nr:filamentous hemagglutinin N-terminal domain-containing protein [Mesorhizobium camelthorni]NGO53481.1 filamentous hemagglutinin N-terminal domain-containing protein [Mesorhizobium camelthorni]
MKRQPTIVWLKTTTTLSSAMLFSLAMGGFSHANPVDGQVVAGEAAISAPNATTLQIDQTSHSAVIEWQSFNIEAGETTRFVQPSREAWTLNRVTGNIAPSRILGTLEANGNVAIVNPDGILFGPDARVDVGGLVATTHDIANDDFMAGRFHFNQPGNPAASVINEGSVSIADYGLAAFVAPGVRNSGVIIAKMGSVSLASGNSFTLDLYGDNLINLTVDDEITEEVVDISTGQPVADLVKNEGRISASGGTVALKAATARRAVNSVVNNTGIVEANSVGTSAGKIVLGGQTAGTKTASAPVQRVKVSGQLLATNIPTPTSRPDRGSGGHIIVTGEVVEVAGAIIDTSGEGGGGTILLGGDYLGGRADDATMASLGIAKEASPVPTASTVTLDSSTTLRADATDQGDGGKVVVWSDEATSVAATITARGGANGGDGGFVETSGAILNIGEETNVSTTAARGETGTWLLDPNDFTVAASGGNITGGLLTAQLGSNNIVISTASQGTPGGNGDIFVNDQVLWNANTLTLRADRNIAINHAMALQDTAGLALQYAQTDSTGDYFINKPVNIASTGSFSTRGNSGTTVNYTIISSLAELQALGLSGAYALGTNLDASATAGWNGGAGFEPIGSGDIDGFTGTFTGLGHTITNLTINRPTEFYVGLFRNTEGDIRDIGLVGGSVEGASVVGMLTGDNTGTITRVYTTGTVIGGEEVGGLVGSNGGSISESFATGSVAGQSAGQTAVGGLVGFNYGSISESFATGSVAGFRDIGGLVGTNSHGTINKSYATGDVTSNGGDTVGGLSGWNSGAVKNSYATGDVSGDDYVGGLIGGNSGTVKNTYAIGNVSGIGAVGGLVGYNDGGTVTASFYDMQTTGQSDTGKGVGLTTDEMKTASTFINAGWDFTNDWDIDPAINNGYPYLRWQVASTPTPDPEPEPEPEPDPEPLTLDPFPSTFSTSSDPYQPTIEVTGSGFSNVTEIRWTWTDPNGNTGTVVWNAANDWGNGRAVLVSDTSATVSPALVAAGDPQGIYQWEVTVIAGSQQITRSFTVDYVQVVQPVISTVPVIPQAILNPAVSVQDIIDRYADPDAPQCMLGTLQCVAAYPGTTAIPLNSSTILQPYAADKTYTVTQDFGGTTSHHKDSPLQWGIDYQMPSGTPVLSMSEGVIIAVEDNVEDNKNGNSGVGNYITIRTNSGVYITYAHLSRGSLVNSSGEPWKQNDKLSAGAPVAKSGNTGLSSGPHLHVHFGTSIVKWRDATVADGSRDVTSPIDI